MGCHGGRWSQSKGVQYRLVEAFLKIACDVERLLTLLEQMNAKLNTLIEQEVGEDIGQMLPGGVDGGWVETDAVNDV
jgi:predicted nucleic acid-binding Zn ribbon protein